MDSSPSPTPDYKHLALVITVAVETLVILGVGAYNIYEIRKNSQLVQEKIQKVSDFSATQAAKLDRLTTAIETYSGAKLEGVKNAVTIPAGNQEKREKADALLEMLKAKKAKAQAAE